MESTQKRTVSIQSVLDMLAQGQDRKAIAEALKLTPAEKKALFAHPKLMKKKVRKPSEIGIEIVDDVADAPAKAVAAAPTVETEPVAQETSAPVSGWNS